MRTKILFISIVTVTLLLASCEDFLNVTPMNKVSGEQLLSDISGIKTLLATLYQRMPVEDFNWNPDAIMNVAGTGNNYDGGWALASHTDEAVISSNAGGSIGPTGDGFWDYTGIRYINQFLESIKTTPMDAATYNRLLSEAHFLRAYMYFGLVKRYGGVPLISVVQQLSSDNSGLYVPRATEKATWDYVLAECDSAILNLPKVSTAVDGTYRATKWSAVGLKCRVALFAASVAKFWNNAPLTGPAVDQKLVGGMTATDANNYYLISINAAKYLIDSSGKTLYKPLPLTAAEAAKNYQEIFETPPTADIEVLFKQGYIDGTSISGGGHATNFYFYPTQTKLGTPYMFARYGVALDQVNLFEDYTDNGVGASRTLVTRTDGVENAYVDAPTFDINLPYKYYDNQSDIFAGSDARLFASVIVPGSSFKGVLINCQGGLIRTDGTKMLFNTGSAVGLDGKTYYGFGTADNYGKSSFDQMGTGWPANYSSTGFILRKFLSEASTPNPSQFSSKQDWIELRMGEIYLNYAEAAIESGQGDPALAATLLNAIRRRAGHLDNIPATVPNIMKERQIELAFENQHYWDLYRRREMHTLFNNYKRKSLIPVLDLRQNPPKYIFVRVYNYYDQTAGGRTFTPQSYYRSIPGTSSNNLVQNPGF